MRNSINKKMQQVVNLNVLLGIITIPVNIVIASSLASAVSAMAREDWQLGIYNTKLFVVFSVVWLLIMIFKKTAITRLASKAKQAFRQSLYDRFFCGNLSTYKTEPGSFTTIFRRDLQQVCSYYTDTLPGFIVAAVGFFFYMVYVCIVLKGTLFAICMIGLGCLSLLQPIILEKFLIKNFIAADKAEAELTQHIVAGREGFVTLKLYKLHEWFMEKYRPKQKAYWKAGVKASASGTFNNAMEDMNRFLQTLGLVSVLGWAILKKWTTFEVAIEIYVLSSSIYAYITTILHIKKNKAQYCGAMRQINKYLPDQEKMMSENLAVEETMELRLSEIDYQIGDKVLMENLSLAVYPGEKCLLCGENGAGKSTLLSIIQGETVPQKGSITFNGKRSDSGIKSTRNCVAYCPQTAPQISCTPRELYERVLRNSPMVSELLLAKYIKEFEVSEDDLNKPMNCLSGGTQKKVILCLALAKQVPILLLDEPEAMLDSKAIEKLCNIIAQQSRTIILVTHNHLFDKFVDSVLTLENRQICKRKNVVKK